MFHRINHIWAFQRGIWAYESFDEFLDGPASTMNREYQEQSAAVTGSKYG